MPIQLHMEVVHLIAVHHMLVLHHMAVHLILALRMVVVHIKMLNSFAHGIFSYQTSHMQHFTNSIIDSHPLSSIK